MDRVFLAIAMFVVPGFSWLAWELGALGNWGIESGYYGQFNRAKHIIEDMPGVTIVDTWQHPEIDTLEEFYFVVLVDGKHEAYVNFSFDSPQMHEKNRERLREFIKQEISADLPQDEPLQ